MTRTRLTEILELLGDETPQGRGDELVEQRQAETLYTWCRDQLDAAKDKGEVARDLQAVLANLTTYGYEDIVTGDELVRRVCDARRANRDRLGDLRRMIAEYIQCSAKLDHPEHFVRREKLEQTLYEFPGALFHALHDAWDEPRARDVIGMLLRRLPRYEQSRDKPKPKPPPKSKPDLKVVK